MAKTEIKTKQGMTVKKLIEFLANHASPDAEVLFDGDSLSIDKIVGARLDVTYDDKPTVHLIGQAY